MIESKLSNYIQEDWGGDRNEKSEKLLKELIELSAERLDNSINHDLLKQLIVKYSSLEILLRKEMEEAKRLSITDPLTQIYNRLKFSSELENEMKKIKRYPSDLSIIMADIDHFKHVNDQFGHNVGDLTLKKFCEIINSCIRETDVFARWGGEEFIILAVNTSLLGAADLAERIRKRVEVTLFEKVEHITCSLGVAHMELKDGPTAFVSRADAALYKAKEGGRNRVETQ